MERKMLMVDVLILLVLSIDVYISYQNLQETRARNAR